MFITAAVQLIAVVLYLLLADTKSLEEVRIVIKLFHQVNYFLFIQSSEQDDLAIKHKKVYGTLKESEIKSLQ